MTSILLPTNEESPREEVARLHANMRNHYKDDVVIAHTGLTKKGNLAKVVGDDIHSYYAAGLQLKPDSFDPKEAIFRSNRLGILVSQAANESLDIFLSSADYKSQKPLVQGAHMLVCPDDAHGEPILWAFSVAHPMATIRFANASDNDHSHYDSKFRIYNSVFKTGVDVLVDRLHYARR